MPCRKHGIKIKNKNAKAARNARVQRSQGEFCQSPLALLLAEASSYLKIKAH